MNIPKIAIIDQNILAAIGLRQLLQQAMPMIEVDTYGSFNELQANHPENYFHYFVAMNIVIANRDFFLERRHQTIVLTPGMEPDNQLSDFHCLSVSTSEEILIRQLLSLEQKGHSGGRNLPEMPKPVKQKTLSDREIEVLSLVAQGLINKEIADQLNIGLSTVITHRKNIQEKLGLKSVSALTIYAVMHGYVDINKI